MSENTIIADTSDLPTADEDNVSEHMEASTQSDPDAKIEFHVQMRSWTQRDMEDLIIEAAARQLVGARGRETQIAKAVEDAAILQITAKADEKLASVATDILDQPVTPTFGAKEPVTLRDFLGLYAKDYLTQKVDREGRPSTSGYDSQPRMIHLIERVMDRKFKAEIEKATNAAIVEIQTAVRDQHKALLAAETARIRDAIAKVTASQ